MNVRECLEWSYNNYNLGTDYLKKYDWAASTIFDLTTYDGELNRRFVNKIIEVCKVILKGETFDYIQDEDNYEAYILVCQILVRNDWIDWGTSIRGAWFNYNPGSIPLVRAEQSWRYDGYRKIEEGHYDIPFTEENLKIFIDFMED